MRAPNATDIQQSLLENEMRSQMTTDPVLECRGVNKCFGKNGSVQALAEISFSLDQGEQLCITGASGSGKTTLLHIIGGLQTPSSGEIVIQGKSLFAMTRREMAAFRARDIGFVFQSAALIPVLSARENIQYALHLARPDLTPKQQAQMVDEVLEVTNLEERKSLRPGELSGGECQRTAIARAVVKRPAFILADEPTSSLDDDNASIINAVFRQLQHHHRSTILIATHDARILSFGNRIIRLKSSIQPPLSSPLAPFPVNALK
jgi:ABC-type lipoprotein export system ATPase subunit